MRRRLIVTTSAALILLAAAIGLDASAQIAPDPPDRVPPTVEELLSPPPPTSHDPTLQYTTYFYTANEAVVHGYEADTEVRIVSMSGGNLIWRGTVGVGETQLVSTGPGVFGFLSNKKASILVGTPSSCTVVGYWLRDQDGRTRSERFYTQLPSSSGFEDDRVIVWAWEDTDVSIHDVTTDTTVFQGRLTAGQRHEITHEQLVGMSSHVLQVQASGADIQVQVYYDEGFAVPGRDGRASGTEFRTYVGRTTEGVNDLTIVSYFTDAEVTVRDIDSDEVIWQGTVPREDSHTLTLTSRYVQVTSEIEVSVYVAPYVHYGAGYAEHHFSLGAEGTGIEHNFLIPTPGELWIFSYFAGSEVTVTNTDTDEVVWTGTLGAGHVQGLNPGHGLFQVTANRGISVQGGSMSCGAEYSPAAGLFQVDETLLAAVVEIQQQRLDAAAREGRVLSADEAAAPLSASELDYATRRVRSSTGNDGYSAAEMEDRLENMVTE